MLGAMLNTQKSAEVIVVERQRTESIGVSSMTEKGGMTIEEALPYLKEHQQELTTRIYRGKYTPSSVRRVEIPKPDGGVRKLGIPTVIDRTLQQAITQQLVPIYEPLFADGSYGYRPNRDAKGAILKVKEYAEQGYTYAVVLETKCPMHKICR